MQIDEVYNPNIRPLSDKKDLLKVADLMEICFGDQMDRDGQEYIKQMRRMALDVQTMSWIPGESELVRIPMNGFVWEEGNRIVGNLTLIPYRQSKRPIYLIANVAVHPDFRRQGIAGRLTKRALIYSKEHHIPTVWLQVRDDNPGAENLYRGLGFLEKTRRTLWQFDGGPIQLPQINSELRIRNRSRQDWNKQRTWLLSLYPPDISWYLSFNINNLGDQTWRSFIKWLDGTSIRHWSAYQDTKLAGVLSWEPSRSYTDILWLATSEEWESTVIEVLLLHAQGELENRKPLSINYPAGRGVKAFLNAGFKHVHTLIWMSTTT